MLRIVVALLLLTVAVPTRAQQPCMPAQAVIAMASEHPNYASHIELVADQVERAGAMFNAYPPETDTQWTLAVLLDGKDGSGALLVGRGNMVCGSLGVDPQHWPAFRHSVLGDGA